MQTSKDAARRWYKARHQELRELFDPLGLLGAPDDEYDAIIDRVLSALVNEGDSHTLAAALRDGLFEMAGEGYSELAAEREAKSLNAITGHISDWWRSAGTPVTGARTSDRRLRRPGRRSPRKDLGAE